jgi:Domain of unknown function (DUF3576)
MQDLGGAARGHRGAKGRDMSAGYYRLLIGVAASVSLMVAGMVAGCGYDRPATVAADPAAGAPSSPPVARNTADPMDTEATLWTVLGFSKRDSEQNVGPQTGNAVSPILWQATQDTLHFAGFASEDPMTGLLVTNWYSPPGKPNERLRVSVFILSRALRSDSLAVTVERQARSPVAEWREAPVARDVVTGLENAILQRARQIRAERYRDTMYK